MADKVMRMKDINQQQVKPNAVTGLIGRSVQRKCAHCEEEEKKKLMRKENGSVANDAVPSSFASSLQASKTGGNTLPSRTRNSMENAFGVDFSGVRIHTGNEAAGMSRRINARAFTYGQDIYFNEGEYSTNTAQGRKLLAHELTHVVQQGGTQQRDIQRAVSSHSHCAANTNNSPANPLEVIAQANDRAVLMALGASHLLFVDSLFMQDVHFGSSGILNMYRRRFGDPTQVTSHRGVTSFKNRFNGTSHNTLIKAQASEMQFLSARAKRVSEFLNGPIRFTCAGTGSFTVGNCATGHCGTSAGMASCPDSSGRQIAVCQNFWAGFPSIDQKAIGMIHEAMHMLFHLHTDFDTTPAGSFAQRRIEPECYASLIADVYGVVPQDPSCPQLPI